MNRPIRKTGPPRRETRIAKVLFDEMFAANARNARASFRVLQEGECQSPRRERCMLCYAGRIEYSAELRLKEQSLGRFWEKTGIRPEPIIPSPLGRSYRTTTKRRVFHSRTGPRLGLIAPDERGGIKAFPVGSCAIEPHGHNRIYQAVQDSLQKPYAYELGEALTYVIVRGNYEEFTVIFNARSISPAITKSINTLSKSLTRTCTNIIGVFLYVDESDGRYYLGAQSSGRSRNLRKVYGKEEIFHQVLGRKFLFSPISFSQVNLSILETLVRRAGELLRPDDTMNLLDLYCGYGLFTLSLAEKFRSATGVELAPLSIESAVSNARRQKQTRTRFIRSDITEESIDRLLNQIGKPLAVILDPPRKGTASGVIERIADHRPKRVLHIFCEIDLIPSEIKRWRSAGYNAIAVQPVDMFPGTSTIETMVLLEPAS